MKLVDALAKFNRKERYWVLRNALSADAAQLDDCFRQRLENTLKSGRPSDAWNIPEHAWWAMDYHIEWIFGAINKMDQIHRASTAIINHDELISGSIIDFDFVISFDNNIILIEAKGVTSWNRSQFHKKLEKMEKIISIQKQNDGYLPNIRLALMSPNEPKRMRPKPGKHWPEWMLRPDGKPYWVELWMRYEGGIVSNDEADFLKTVRCTDAYGTSGRSGSFWKIEKC